VLSTRVDTLVEATQWLLQEPVEAQRLGSRAREVALERYNVDRFLSDWDQVLRSVCLDFH
jgi:glycosyltransferase involved in cell wall biosynthesis